MIIDYACEYLKGNMTLKETFEYVTRKIEEKAWEEAMEINTNCYFKGEINDTTTCNTTKDA